MADILSPRRCFYGFKTEQESKIKTGLRRCVWVYVYNVHVGTYNLLYVGITYSQAHCHKLSLLCQDNPCAGSHIL